MDLAMYVAIYRVWNTHNVKAAIKGTRITHYAQQDDYVSSLIKSSWATSHVNWLKGEKPNVSRTISVLILRVLMYLENQSVAYIGLPDARVSRS
jgi:hypothetical protein